ncbi:hypothetical protein Zm00014a_013542 [Zea mays]|uniref:Uncharacterized protein n=1 Tax=Zea mays TaxID=4577 RepID=A0A3L6G9I6_MAIZE|nr:hypothetical protein Zm00014a_013542 [Zea mays]
MRATGKDDSYAAHITKAYKWEFAEREGLAIRFGYDIFTFFTSESTIKEDKQIIRQKHLLLPVLEAWRLAGANRILCVEKQVKEAIVQVLICHSVGL